MKKSKKKIVIVIIVLLFLLLGFGIFNIVSNFRDENALTLDENKWIDSNKRNVIDIALLNDIPIVSYEGDGLIYDYLDYVSKNLSLEFNVIPYKTDDTVEYEYKVDLKDKVSEDDIVLLKDNMVLITTSGNEYERLEDIKSLKIGVVEGDISTISEYFDGQDITFEQYDNYSSLKDAIKKDETDQDSQSSDLDGIILPKTLFIKEMLENDYKISFQLNDLSKYVVLLTEGPKNLNSIFHKSYNSWKKDNYEDSYNSNLLEDYFSFKNVSDLDRKKLNSKSYVFGFIDYGIYSTLDNKKISGLSGLILKGFNKFSGISITYTKYNSINKLLQDINSNKVDFTLNIVNDIVYVNEVYNTAGIFNKNLAIISGNDNEYIIDSVNSLKDKEVSVVKGTYLEKFVVDNGAKIKSYNNLSELVKDFKDDDITIIDLENYNYYKTSYLKDTKINYLVDSTGKYNYVINDFNDNKVFENIFDFYVSFISFNELYSLNYSSIAYENVNVIYLLVIIIIALCIYLVIDFSAHFKVMLKTMKKNKKVHLSKEDKMKYIDQLTSLKNRAYLNSKIESWDDSEVYPQAIIIIDLNNISYINDNYGREEGDRVITEAANILIMHQLHNSEIIRTDGNEFLIYLVGYSEKQVISYLRKLNKELKGLSHGFGAASGYSIISDAIKTVDDAVNEATLDMKNNKEDIEY